MNWWCQNADDTAGGQLKGQLILLPIRISLSELEEWLLEAVSVEGKRRDQKRDNQLWLAEE